MTTPAAPVILADIGARFEAVRREILTRPRDAEKPTH